MDVNFRCIGHNYIVLLTDVLLKTGWCFDYPDRYWPFKKDLKQCILEKIVLWKVDKISKKHFWKTNETTEK